MREQGRFGTVLRRPGVPSTLLPYALSRLSATMLALSLLLYGKHVTGSFGTAGALCAAFATASALAAPALGRTVDTRGQWPVLAPCSVVQPLALVSAVLCLRNGQVALAMLAAAVAGAVMPPVTACMRSLWPQLVDDEELMGTAWSIEGLMVEATELGGPLLTALLVMVVDPVAAVLVTAGLSYCGGMLFALTTASRQWRSARGETRPGLGRGPLAIRGVRSLVGVVFVTTAGLAALEVAVAAFASEHGRGGATGLLMSGWLAASLLGGWLYGRRSWRSGLEVQLPLLLAACGLTALTPLLAHGLLSMGLLLVVAGLAIAPATSVQFAVMSRVAPERSRTEAFTWASTASFLGVALGNWLTGALTDHGGARAGIVLAGLLGLGAAVTATVLRSAFVDPAQLPAARDRAERRAVRRSPQGVAAAS